MEKWIWNLLVVFIVALFGVGIYGMEVNARVFEAECEKINGKAVWDGRQYQCFR